MEIKFRPLHKYEIQCRLKDRIIDNNNGTFTMNLLLHKDARCDQRILDETVGKMNWKKEYFERMGDLYCRISIKDSITGEWIGKEDAGSRDTNFEPEKSLASSAQKRAGFAWGIGRALYTPLDISFLIYPNETYTTPGGKTGCNLKFFVDHIRYDASNEFITELRIVDTWGRPRYVYPQTLTLQPQPDAAQQTQESQPQAQKNGNPNPEQPCTTH